MSRREEAVRSRSKSSRHRSRPCCPKALAVIGSFNNLAYAVRLGLWGPETAFSNREQFISGIRKGGIAAMELVAVRRGGAIERSDDMSSG